MEFKKNQDIILKIDDLGNNGEGIGHVDGYALFVKEALPGETIRASIMKCKKNYGFARLLEVLEPSPNRIKAACSAARPCGGCTLQHLSYDAQLIYKENKVKNCLTRIGGVDLTDVEWLPILGMKEETPWHYRNKAQFPVREQLGGDGTPYPVTGFYAGHSHRVIPMTDCAIQAPIMREILQIVLDWMQDNYIPAYNEEHQTGLVRHIYIRTGYHTGQILVCLVVNAPNKKKMGINEGKFTSLVDNLAKIDGMTSICLNFNSENTNVILGKKTVTIWGEEYIEDTIGDIRYRISPQSFYQVNPVQTEKLYRTALDFADIKPGETVWDLYCGIGTISLFIARELGDAGEVIGVEIVPEAIENAKENARLNGINNARFYVGAAEEVVPKLISSNGAEFEKAEVVVVDPPRKGCDPTLLDTIVRMSPQRIVYVSCDPATLARDVKILGEKGYQVKKVRACDMFPMGGHVETVCLLSKKP
ncbi:MAG: 23S rRNA (uracil(1939)-C(5))-methyltransferase RlmD [Eubacterium sp.]